MQATLYQEGISFGLLGPGRTGLECAVVASWIRLVQNRLKKKNVKIISDLLLGHGEIMFSLLYAYSIIK